jgi:hypothetical protein
MRAWGLGRAPEAQGKWGFANKAVMPGLVPGIHILVASRKKDVDGRDKPGHDESFGE